MRGDRAFAQALRQLAGDALGHPARVDEHERRAPALDEPRHPIVDFGPDLARHHRFERRAGQNQIEIASALMAGVNDRRVGGRGFNGRNTDQKSRNGANRILRGGEADALQPVAAQCAETLQRQGEMRAALVRRDGVDFIDDHRAGGRQHLASGLRAQQDVEGFGRRHQDMRRAAAHALAFCGRRVARSHPGADLDIGEPAAPKTFPDAGEGRLQVAVDIVRQSLERRNVDHVGLVAEPPLETRRTRSSIAARKAASVLPEPVGAAIRVWRPALIAGQASDWAGVGARKLSANHSPTAGWNSLGPAAFGRGRSAMEGAPRGARLARPLGGQRIQG